MSSHHIIREDQEPALLIDDLDAVSESLFGQLLEWSPTVLAGDDALSSLQARGVKVDVWFTNHDNAPLPQDHTIIKPAGLAWMETALDYLKQHGQRAVNILSKKPEVHALMYRYAEVLNVVLLGNGQRIVVAKPGFSKWKPKGETIWLYGNVDRVALQGLTPVVETGVYTTLEDGFFSVVFDDAYGLVGERL